MTKREQEIQSLIEQVSKIPVQDVVGRVVDLVPRGKYYLGLCPFHEDHHLGGFVVTPDMGLWRCFSEGIGGTGIKFEMLRYNLKFIDAVLKLALDFGIIGQKEFDALSTRKYNRSMLQAQEKRLTSMKKVKELPKADADVISNVYHQLVIEAGLSKKDHEPLLKDRNLTEDDMGAYFTFPSKRRPTMTEAARSELADRLSMRAYGVRTRELKREEAAALDPEFKRLQKEGPYSLKFSEVSLFRKSNLSMPSKIIYGLGMRILKQEETNNPPVLSKKEAEKVDHVLARVEQQFASVPGFFRNERGEIDYVAYKGIGLLAEDEKGRAVGIQVRRTTVREGESRYIWMSSAFAGDDPKCSGGASSGCPGGFIHAKASNHKPALCITEGRFKAEQIAACGNDAIYVSGVSTWRTVIPMILRTAINRNKVYVMFDADAMGNTAVHKQLSAFSEALEKEGMLAILILWPKEAGKGFDDLVINKGRMKYASYLVSRPFADFERSYQDALKTILRIHEVQNVAELPKEEREEFAREMQARVEYNVGLKKAQ